MINCPETSPDLQKAAYFTECGTCFNLKKQQPQVVFNLLNSIIFRLVTLLL